MTSRFRESVIRALGRQWESSRSYRTPFLMTCTALLITSVAWKKATYKPELLPPAPKDHRRIRVTESDSSSFTLPDGRKIGYAQFGDQKGKPIITLHGILGSRLDSALFDDSARALGARIIGIERPSTGWSSPDPRPLRDRTLLDHAHDVEALAEHLHLSEYAVLGTSGGGPFALACAHSLPTAAGKPRLKAVSIVTGAGLPDMSQSWPSWLVYLNKQLDLRWLMKIVFTMAPEWQLGRSDDERMEAMRKSFDLKKAHPGDIESARNPEYPAWVRLFLQSSRQAVLQGWTGFLDDCALLTRDPGFRVESIRADLPIQLWYGTDDTNISPKAGDETAERLKAGGNFMVKLHMFPGETHGSTQIKYRKQQLKDLLQAMEP